MQTASSPLSCIYVSSPERHHLDPYSPLPPTKLDDHDSFRAKCLITAPRHSSPLRPTNGPVSKGLDRGQIDSFLNASHGRKPLLRTQKTPNLRKQLALKNQRSKQLERRALLLSKVEEVMTITAESSCALSSPVPPLLVFEYATNGNTCFEDVAALTDVSRLHGPVPKTRTTLPIPRTRSKKVPPSLDEITARLGGSFVRAESVESVISPSRLPSFPRTALPPSSVLAPAENRPLISVGRLRLPIRSNSFNDPPVEPSSKLQVTPCMPRSVLTTAAIPRAASGCPPVVGDPGSCAVERSCTAKNMMLTLTRRSSPPPPGHCPVVRTPMKRRSAPAELRRSGRSDFDHAVLSMPGGF